LAERLEDLHQPLGLGLPPSTGDRVVNLPTWLHLLQAPDHRTTSWTQLQEREYEEGES
jgi:hypothetical protein